MTVIFKDQGHLYESLDPAENIKWLSVTKFVEKFKQKFDPITQSQKSVNNPKSKWYGMDPLEVQRIWAEEGDRGSSEGHFYHGQRETDVTDLDTITREGRPIPIIKPIYMGDTKHSPVQKLTEGIYPEHFVYLKSAGICGQSDRVEVVKNLVHIIDYKTNKEIKKESYRNWEGVPKMMLGPCEHLEDCNFNHYALQLSTYLYIILKHNPQYLPGKLMLHHVIFEVEGEDKFGYPIRKKNPDGSNIVKTIVPYEVPYLRTEVRNMIKWLQDNSQ